MRNFSVDALYVYHETLPLRESQERFRRALRESSAGRRVGSEDARTGSTGGGRGGGRGGAGGGGADGDTGGGVGLKRVNRPPVNRLRLDVPELSSDLDSRQVWIISGKVWMSAVFGALIHICHSPMKYFRGTE